MLIGVDESGTFTHGSFAYFAAAHIRPSLAMEVAVRHRDWERELRRSGLAGAGEIKGSQLEAAAFELFFERVLEPSWPWVRYTALGVAVDQPTLEFVRGQRELTAEQFAEAVRFYEKRDGRRSKIANQMDNLRAWWTHRSDDAVLKVSVLGALLADSLRFAVGYSAAMGFDAELPSLQFKIDQGLWRNRDQERSWREILRNQLWHQTYRRPIPVIRGWEPSHPFYTHIAEVIRGDRLQLKSDFKDRFQFVDSKSTFEARIADVLAALVRRVFMRSTGLTVSERLERFHTEPGRTCTALAFSPEREAPPPNPWIEAST